MRDEILKAFKNTSEEMIDLLSSLNEEELNQVPKDGSWSAGQLGEHVLLSYGAVDVLNGAVRLTERAPDQKVEEVRKLFLNFDIKMGSPEEIVPDDKPKEKSQLIDRLKHRFSQMEKVIKERELEMVCIDYAIPEYGEFTRLEWIWFNIVHTQRHVHQLKNIIQIVKPERAMQ